MMHHLGIDIREQDQLTKAAIDQGIDKFREMRDNGQIRAFFGDTSSMIEALGNEEIDVALGWNEIAWNEAKIIIAGDNFGCGSSREHAPWALLDFGIKCVISTSFADIFYNNCFKNGILPIKVTEDQRQALLADAKDAENPILEIDLPNQVIQRPNGVSIKFELDPFRKECLLEGLDDISLTLDKKDKIQGYESDRDINRPWL